MKKIIVILISLFSIIPALFAQSPDTVIQANNQFTFELYSRYSSNEENIFFSPYSISSALAMAYEGARGKTADEIQAVFHFPKDEALRREGFLNINNRLNKKDKKYELNVANALWAQKDYLFLENYFKLMEDYYGGKVTNLDFSKETEGSRVIINAWVEEKTKNRIQNLIAQGMLAANTRLVLTNAIYFKGLWFEQFLKENTQDRDFRVAGGNTIKVRTMSLTGKTFAYAETKNLQVLELPYQGKELSALILLPKDDDLKSIENSLSAGMILDLRKQLISERVDVYLPKFKFENKYSLSSDLKNMGMVTAFSDYADFSGMTEKKDLYISEVIHKAFVEVNEEGAEAAAATAVIMQRSSAVLSLQEPKINIFKADHPFIFIIQERETGNILFLGRVNDPTKSF